MNSFKYGCVVNGKWYCNRPFLERELSKFVASGQNVVLLGERRMGKTSLLHETLRGMKGWRLIYIDLLHIHSVEDEAAAEGASPFAAASSCRQLRSGRWKFRLYVRC